MTRRTDQYEFDAHKALKNAVRARVATTANITIATALNDGDSLDGVTLDDGDIILVKDQSSAAENGIYVVSTIPIRHPDFTDYDSYPGVSVTVEEGTAGAGTIWRCSSSRGGTIDTTSITFSLMVSAVGSQPLDDTLTALAGTGITYEIDTWTPTVTATSGTFTSVSGSGVYVKIGRMVTVWITITITTNGTAAGSVVVTLPFSPDLNVSSGGGRANAIGGFMLQGVFPSGGNLRIYKYDNTYPGASGETLLFSGTYRVAA